jgi:imidazolonepropionase-like amidohydrolase
MERWVEAGVSEAALFRALTVENARAFGLDGELGTIEPGRKAHLLLLDENPLEDVSAWDAIDTVILAGRPIDRESLAVDGSR